MDHANLDSGNRWKVFWKVRGQSTAEDDVMEARLDDPAFGVRYSSEFHENEDEVAYFKEWS